VLYPAPQTGASPAEKPDAVQYPPAALSTMDPRTAMAWALGQVLGGAVFVRPGAEGGPPVPFALDCVFDQWPTSQQIRELPCASIVDEQETEMEAHNLVPTILEETRDQFCEGSVLWQDNRAATTLQVDIWAQYNETVSGVISRLPAIFNPSEVRAGILVEVPEYYCRKVRLTLLNYRPINTAASVFENERRILCRVRAEVDSVHLRFVEPLTVNNAIATAEGGHETGEP